MDYNFFLNLRNKDKFAISASSEKLYSLCSWKYFCSKVLKIPIRKNSGMVRGDLVHIIFECLLNPRHKKHYITITKNKDVRKCAPVYRLILKIIKRSGLEEFDNKGINNLDLICEMILVGLKYDFYCSKYQLIGSEQEIRMENNNLKLVGYIDKLAYDNKKNRYIIQDFKSSAESDDFTTQALTYILWAKRVKNADAVAEFIYLRQDKDNIQKYKFNDNQILGFELYMRELYKELRDITVARAMSHFAYDDGWKNEGFKGAVVCGRSQYRGELKKDGTEMWACEYKHPIEYYILFRDKDFYSSSYNKEDLEEQKKQLLDKDNSRCYDITKISYDGCPRFYNQQ